MKTFLELLSEEEKSAKHHVMTFGRMNPPTTGHLKLIHKVHDVAQKLGASHSVVTSHSQDSKKNPLSAAQKVKHLKRYSPGTHFVSASKDKPTILHHAADLHKKGVTHLHVVVGSDRQKEMHHLLNKYNGVEAGHGKYNFKKITVHSAGHRDPDAEGTEGMSGTKMREHAKNKDLSSFKKGVPSHVPEHHAKELMHDVRKGMGLHESTDRGLFKAVFVTGGPGSGKDVIIREAIAECNAVELNTVQAFEFLVDKVRLSEKTNDYRREALRNRSPLVINGPADDYDRISHIKEELEDMGYETLMIFVDTTNEASQERNSKLSRMMVESVRQDKWNLAQQNKRIFSEKFNKFIYFENNKSIEQIEEDITDTYQEVNVFFEEKINNDIALSWLDNHGKLNINEKFNNLFKENKNVESNSKIIQKINTRTRYNPAFRAASPSDIPADNRAGDPNADDIKWNRNAKRGSYTFKTYSEAKNEPTVKVTPQAKETNFSQDNDKNKVKKRGDKSLSAARIGRPDGVSQEYDTRAGGQGAAAGAGLGNQTYSETTEFSNADVINFAGMAGGPKVNPLDNTYDKPKKDFKNFRKKIKESIDDPGANDMGVGGTLGGATNKEGMDSYKDPMRNVGIQIKKKKKQEK